MTAEGIEHQSGDPGDPGPRPVFEGDWAKATGQQRQAHMTRIAAWKAAWKAKGGGQGPEARGQGAKGRGASAGSGSGKPSSQAVGDANAAAALSSDPNYQALVAIRDNPNAHDSDRIRATDAIVRMQQRAEGEATGESPLVELRRTLELLPPHERLAWLQGERLGGKPLALRASPQA